MLKGSLTTIPICMIALLAGCVFGDEQDTHNPVEKLALHRSLDLTRSHYNVGIRANSSDLHGAGEWVAVHWWGVDAPSPDDWVAVITAKSEDIRDATPIKYKLAASSRGYLESGHGSANFYLENHRTNLKLAFFLNGFANPHLVAQTDSITCLNAERPSHARISLTGDPSEILIQWTTGSSGGGIVRWGLVPGSYSWQAAARELTYTRDEMCGGAAAHEGWIDPGVFHFALLTGLKPRTRYYYTFGSRQTGFAAEKSFVSAPPAGPDTEVHVLALADMGQAEVDGSNEQSEMMPSLNTTRLMLRDLATNEYGLLVHYGDISYARGHVSQWDRYHVQIEPLVSRVPYMIGIGNHERDWPGSGDRFPSMTDSGGECGVAHERRFLMPSSKQDEPWFHYEWGPIHFIHYSTEHEFQEGSVQHDFVADALASIDRRRTPWVVFAGHRPMYIDSTNDAKYDGDLTVAADLQEAFEELLKVAGVDVTLHGHHHSYQRTCPLYRGQCEGYGVDGVARAPVHLVIGNAGADLCTNIQRQQPEVFEKVHLWWGYIRIHATGTMLHIEAVSDQDGKVYDTLELSKPSGWGAQWHAEHGEPSLKELRQKWWWESEVIDAPPQVLRSRTGTPSPADTSATLLSVEAD